MLQEFKIGTIQVNWAEKPNAADTRMFTRFFDLEHIKAAAEFATKKKAECKGHAFAGQLVGITDHVDEKDGLQYIWQKFEF